MREAAWGLVSAKEERGPVISDGRVVVTWFLMPHALVNTIHTYHKLQAL